MREILFRGKAKSGYKWISEGEWIEGSLFYSDDENGTVCQIATSYLSSKKDEAVMVVAYEVDPSTVCQYTGLTDKNDRKIFEGDIIKTSQYGVDDGKGHNFAGFDTFSVEFSDASFCLKNKWRRFNLRPSREAEVIGNIFDNPELIGE